jgi:phosphopantetheinyl transferase (holo-ACP synthase)
VNKSVVGRMAYRRATGGGEAHSQAHGQAHAPSFLDEFLDQIQPMPAQIKAKFAEMRELDDRANTLMSDAELAAADAVKKASIKSTGGNDPLKRAFQDMLACQAKAGDCASKKIELAENAYQVIEDTIKTLDDRLRAYEAQLKKEGRWPAATEKKEAANPRKSAGGRSSFGVTGSAAAAGIVMGGVSGDEATVVNSICNDVSAGASVPLGPGVAATTSNIKSRKRDREKDKSVSRASQEKERAAKEAEKKAKKTAKLEPNLLDAETRPEGLVVIEDMNIPEEEPRYCYCQQISYGDMVGCESDDCTYQWFHYVCVGLTSEPKGDWYCPECTAKLKKKKKKK